MLFTREKLKTALQIESTKQNRNWTMNSKAAVNSTYENYELLVQIEILQDNRNKNAAE